MKKLLFLTLMLGYGWGYSQTFSGKTNEIVLNFKNPIQPVTSLPIIIWESPRIEQTFSQVNSLDIEFMVNSEVPLKNVKMVLGDGTTIMAEKPVVLESNELSRKVKQHLTLFNGQNSIEVVVENVNGGAMSSSRFVLVGKDAIANAVDINRKDMALIFATNSYDDLNNLVNPIEDSNDIAEILRTKFGFVTEVILNPTHEEIYEKISEYNAKRFNPQDQLLVFFAGHGIYDENLSEGFVAARNSLANDKGRSTYIPHSILRQRLDNIKCEHIFLVMDVCFGGTLDPEFAKNRSTENGDTSDTDLLIRKLSQKTRKFLTSGSKEYVSDGVPGKHSPFASLFIQALKESGGKGNRIMTLYDLYPYFQRMKTQPRFGKFSEKDESTSDFVFVVSQN